MAADQRQIDALIRTVGINPMGIKWPLHRRRRERPHRGRRTGQTQHGDGAREVASIAVALERQGMGIGAIVATLVSLEPAPLFLFCAGYNEGLRAVWFSCARAGEMPRLLRRISRQQCHPADPPATNEQHRLVVMGAAGLSAARRRFPPPGDRLYSPVTMPNQPQNRAEFVASLPRKRMAAGMLVLDERARVLVVKPTYRDGWLIPGGGGGRRGAGETCRREVAEELGIALPVGRLLCMEYLPAYDGPHGERTRSSSTAASWLIRFSNGCACRRTNCPKRALRRRRKPAPAQPRGWPCAAYALDALKTGTVHYLEDGRPVASNP